jgi:hypothetical protein
MSRGAGRVEREIMAWFTQTEGYWDAKTIAKVVFRTGPQPSPSQINSVRRALRRLAQRGEIRPRSDTHAKLEAADLKQWEQVWPVSGIAVARPISITSETLRLGVHFTSGTASNPGQQRDREVSTHPKPHLRLVKK